MRLFGRNDKLWFCPCCLRRKRLPAILEREEDVAIREIALVLSFSRTSVRNAVGSPGTKMLSLQYLPHFETARTCPFNVLQSDRTSLPHIVLLSP